MHPPSDRHKHLHTPLHRSLPMQAICLGWHGTSELAKEWRLGFLGGQLHPMHSKPSSWLYSSYWIMSMSSKWNWRSWVGVTGGNSLSKAAAIHMETLRRLPCTSPETSKGRSCASTLLMEWMAWKQSLQTICRHVLSKLLSFPIGSNSPAWSRLLMIKKGKKKRGAHHALPEYLHEVLPLASGLTRPSG